MAEECTIHGTEKVLACLSCKGPMCHNCKYYLLRGKTWCEQCVAPYIPKRESKLKDGLIVVAKFWGLFALTILAYLIMPAAKIGAAAICAGLYLRFVVFRDFGEEKMVLEEVVGGNKRQISP
jgi:hypothetical protein